MTGLRVGALLALSCVAVRAWGQATGVVYGSASDSGGAPIADVRITTAGAAATSDVAGRFRLPGIPPGRVVLRFARLGYRVTQDTVAVPAGGPVRGGGPPRPPRFALE